MPQGTILGPILFNIYTSPIAAIALYCSTPASNKMQTIHRLILLSLLRAFLKAYSRKLSYLQAWFCHNGLALNPDKTYAILSGTRNKLSFLSTLTYVNVAGTSVQRSKKLKIPGATLDQHLFFQNRVNTVCSASFYHLLSFHHVRPALTQGIAKTLGSAVIGAKLDHVNDILHGTTPAIIKLQHVQNMSILKRILTKRH
jgi:hypothetical protein